MSLRDSPHPYAATTILFWSLAYVLTRLALRYFTAFPLGFLRYAAASAALAVVFLVRRPPRPKPADLPWFLAAGACGFALYMLAFNTGCRTVPAAAASLVIATVPVWTALSARVVFRERLSARRWIATGIEFGGVAVLTLSDGGFRAGPGVLWLLLAALLLSAYNLIQRRLSRVYGGFAASGYGIFAGTLLLAVFLPGSVREIRTAPAPQIGIVVILGVFCGAAAYAAWSMAFARAPQTSVVSNYMFATPFLTAILGFLLAGEVPDLSTILGGTVILAGFALFRSEEMQTARAKTRKTKGDLPA